LHIHSFDFLLRNEKRTWKALLTFYQNNKSKANFKILNAIIGKGGLALQILVGYFFKGPKKKKIAAIAAAQSENFHKAS
jgi:hypothetical protein